MSLRRVVLAMLLAFAGWAHPAGAWNATGHRIVAEIAMR